jgi:hypothetical protein
MFNEVTGNLQDLRFSQRSYIAVYSVESQGKLPPASNLTGGRKHTIPGLISTRYFH